MLAFFPASTRLHGTDFMEQSKPKSAPPARRFDLQDGLVASGFVALVVGVAAIYWPAALILAGLLFFGFAALIEFARAKEEKQIGTPHS